MRVNAAGLNLLRQAEGEKLLAYKDIGGVWTIGRGHTRGVYPGMQITTQQSDQFLAQDVQEMADQVTGCLTRRLGENQFSALVVLAYNVGIGNLAKSHIFQNISAGKLNLVADEMLTFDHVDGRVVNGLLRRGEAERALFLKPDSLLARIRSVLWQFFRSSSV